MPLTNWFLGNIPSHRKCKGVAPRKQTVITPGQIRVFLFVTKNRLHKAHRMNVILYGLVSHTSDHFLVLTFLCCVVICDGFEFPGIE